MRLRATEAIFRLNLRGRNAIQFDALSLVGGGKFRVILAGGKARYAMRVAVLAVPIRVDASPARWPSRPCNVQTTV